MNPIDRIFPTSELSADEESLIIEIFSHTTVKKYLQILGANDSKELLTLPILDETPDSLARKHTLVSGKLAVITTLLSLSEYKK
jgi:hypothetical protein